MRKRKNRLAADLWPHIQKRIADGVQITVSSSGGSSGGAPSPHDLDSIHHSGTLDESQFPEALLIDGSRNLEGNLSVDGGVTIDGVDLSSFYTSYNAHVGGTAKAQHTGGLGTHTHQSAGAEGGQLDHGLALTGLSDDDHPQYAQIAASETITGLWTYDRDPNAPFAVAAGSAVVTNLDADLLDGLHASNNPGASAAVVATDAAGGPQLLRLGMGVSPDADDKITVVDGGKIGSPSGGPLVEFDDTNDFIEITGASVGIGLTDPGAILDVRSTGADHFRLSYDASNYVDMYTDGGGTLTILPIGDIILYPGGSDVRPGAPYEINIGTLTEKYLTLHCAELWVSRLVAEDVTATIGGRIVAAPTTVLAADLPVPSVTYVNQATAALAVAGTSITVGKPPSTAEGDLMIAQVTIDSATTISPPSSWTLIRSDEDSVGGGIKTSLYYKLAGDSEPASYQWTFGASTYARGTIQAWRGVDPDIPVDVDSGACATGTSATAPGVTTTYEHTVLLYLASTETNGVTTTEPSGMTERYDYSGQQCTGESASLALSSRGATGNKTGTLSSSVLHVAQLVAIVAEGTVLKVEHNEMASGDTEWMESNGHVEFMAIVSAPSGTGPYFYVVDRNKDGSGLNDWYAGDAVVNTGATGDGWIEIYSVQGILGGGYGPTIVMNVRGSATYNDWAEHAAIGNLENLYDYATTTYGVALGKYATGQPWVGVDATNGVRIMRHTTKLAQWDTSGNILIGQQAVNQSNVYLTSGGVQMRTNTTVHVDLQSDGDVFIGENTAAAATTNIAIFTTAQTYNSESMSAGDFLIGDNSAGKANIFWDKSAGKLQFRGGTTMQCEIGTDGALLAAAGALALDSDGIAVEVTTSWEQKRGYQFVDSGANLASTLEAFKDGSMNYLRMRSEAFAGLDTYMLLTTEAPSGQTSLIFLSANITGGNEGKLYIYPTYLYTNVDMRILGGLVTGSSSVDPPSGCIAIQDGVSAPSTIAGFGIIYIDTADGDLKIKFGDGTVKTIVVDT